MSQFTSQWLAARLARSEASPSPLMPTDNELESDLHDMIIAWANRQDPQIPIGHSRMDKKSTYTEGFPDFLLLLPNGRSLLIECKTSSGEMSDEQKIFASKAKMVGHTVHVVRTYPEFLTLVKQTL